MTEKTGELQGRAEANKGVEGKVEEKVGMDRRDFLSATATVGGAMVLGFWLPPARARAAGSGLPATAGIDSPAAAGNAAAQIEAPALAGALPGVAAEPWYRNANVPEINAWITIAPDDTVTIRVGQTDIGTGVFTSNAMMVAEELQCDWKKVHTEYASANRDFKEMAPEWTLKAPGNGDEDPAGGGAPGALKGEDGVYRRMTIDSSGSVRESRFYLQQAGAEARERLLLAAATEWGVPVSELVAKDSVITHAKTNRKTTYGAIAGKAAQTPLPDPSKIKIKSADQFTLLGTEQKNFDVPVKVTGQAIYGIDIRLPGMLYAAAKNCPVWGYDLKSYNADAVMGMPGVHSVVQFPFDPRHPVGQGAGKSGNTNDYLSGGVAVIADSWWHAKKALDALPVEWNTGPNATVSSQSLFDDHVAKAKEPAVATPTNVGDVDAAWGQAAKVVEAIYSAPYSPRARLEPGDATALVTDNRVDVWTGDQAPQGIHRVAAKVTGISPENVFVHSTFQGGGYGAGANGCQGQQAIYLAKVAKGRPVKLLWTREEDMTTGNRYRPMSVCLMKAGLDAQGWPIAMEVRHSTEWGVGQGARGLLAPPYFMPNYRLTIHMPKTHVPFGNRRSSGAQANVFYMEGFIDELAHAAGKDPLAYRRELITRNPPAPGKGVGGFQRRDDWLRALDMVEKMSGWGTPLPAGWARGIAIDDRRTTTSCVCAHVHTVEVTKRGELKLHRSDIVFEQGFSLMNPLSVRKQIEGQIAWSYSDAMYQGTTIKDGRAVERNFDTFQISRMNEYPKEVNIAFMKTDRWIEGVGDESLPHIVPAIFSAVFQITGKRFRSFPIRNQDLSWA